MTSKLGTPRFLIAFALSTLMPSILADPAPAQAVSPQIAIIIDDLGHQKKQGERAVDLAIPLTVAVLPRTPFSQHLAKYAHSKDKDVLLHLPMQPSSDLRLMTPNTLSIDMDEKTFRQQVRSSLADVPHIKGVNNHMGSLFTQLPEQMSWLMDTLNSHRSPLFFVDSYTSERSIAFQVAEQHSIPHTRRDVFLDRNLDPVHMQSQIEKMKRLARQHGSVVVIGHPFEETLDLLEAVIPQLKKEGFQFVKVSILTALQNTQTSINDQDDKHSKQTLH